MGRIELHLDAEDVEALAEDVLGRLQEMMSAGVIVPRLLKVSQVAEILQVPPPRVYAMLYADDPLPSIRLADRTLRIDPRALSRWLEEHPNVPTRGGGGLEDLFKKRD